MKTFIFTLILTLFLGSFSQTEAQTNQQFKLRVSNQKAVAAGKLTIKFVSVLEDSRCPKGVNCIHAGNAKIQIKVSKRGVSSKTFDLNTDLQPNSITFEGYEIKLVSLTPVPNGNARISDNAYTAGLTVSKSSNSK